jgi:serine protease Do
MRRYGIRGGSLFLTLGLLATLTFALGVFYLDPGDAWTQTDGSQAAQAGVSVEEPVARVAYRLGPSAVQINVAGVQQTPYGTQEGEGIGSGVIYRSDGYIITNHHVVEGAREVDVSFVDGTTERGKVVGTDPTTEIAVIEVNRDNLPAANFVEEQDPVVGQMTIAVGSPSGFESTVTSGVVSGVGREVPSEYTGGRQDNALVDLIQTDAAISPGNSGGALANRDGEIIGINVAYLPPSETGAVNLGFAIPSDTATSIADQLIETGEVSTPYLGVVTTDLSPEDAERFGLPMDSGALVTTVEPGSGAAAAGVRRGDVITVLGGSDVEGYGDLLGALRDYQPGDTARLTVFRNGDERTLDVTLSERPK